MLRTYLKRLHRLLLFPPIRLLQAAKQRVQTIMDNMNAIMEDDNVEKEQIVENSNM